MNTCATLRNSMCYLTTIVPEYTYSARVFLFFSSKRRSVAMYHILSNARNSRKHHTTRVVRRANFTIVC
jgi:hypothetical protein